MGRYSTTRSPETRIKLPFEKGLFYKRTTPCERCEEENKEHLEKMLAGGFPQLKWKACLHLAGLVGEMRGQ